MGYSKEEIAQIQKNIEAVNNWLLENIVPYLRNDDKITVGFGEMEPIGRGCWGKEHHYSLTVRGNKEIYFRTGGAVFGFNLPDYRKDDDMIVNKSLWSWGMKLLDQWRIVKPKLIDELEVYKQKYSAVFEFEV